LTIGPFLAQAGRGRKPKARMTAEHVDPTRERFAAFKALPREGVIHMLNLVRFRDHAAYPENHPDAGAGRTGREAYRAYAAASAPAFARVGGRQVWLAAPELTLIGPEEERWDLCFVAEYPSADAFIAMLRDPEYRAAVVHRQAAVADSRLARVRPKAPGAAFGEAR
jgi:uncharacterized protein (DUF1330 family)